MSIVCALSCRSSPSVSAHRANWGISILLVNATPGSRSIIHFFGHFQKPVSRNFANFPADRNRHVSFIGFGMCSTCVKPLNTTRCSAALVEQLPAPTCLPLWNRGVGKACESRPAHSVDCLGCCLVCRSEPGPCGPDVSGLECRSTLRSESTPTIPHSLTGNDSCQLF